MANRLADCPMFWLRFLARVLAFVCYAAVRYLGAWGFWDFGFPRHSLAALSQISYTFALCSFFFFGSHCCMWHMANRCRTSSFESQQRKKYPQLHWEGVYCLVQKECMYSALMLTLLFNVIQKYKPIKVLAF